MPGRERLWADTLKQPDFALANRLWFRDGRTARALAAYDAAHRAAPADPVVAFQYARALWSSGQVGAARAVLERASTQRQKLSRVGQAILDQWLDIIRTPPPSNPRYPLDLLDRDRIEASTGSVMDWRGLADAAHSRGMYGLATYALDRWIGIPIDSEDARDIERIVTSRSTNEAMLAEMAASDEGPRAPRPGPDVARGRPRRRQRRQEN